LAFECGHCFRDQALSLCRDRKDKSEDTASFRFESGNLETLKKMVDQGVGYTLLPHLAIKELVSRDEKERVKEFASPVPTREVSIVHHQHFTRSAIVEAVTSEIRKAVPKDVLNFAKGETKVIPI
jgi:LysR family transcriptional regulator, hydrogen peroxide-inducible genes activator